uniref:Protein HGH1 C-terminal domain-containing protein n=1 Tax=Romanomermis culicivorax TaxID=13658 RepID=A0A915KBY0_ROMCU
MLCSTKKGREFLRDRGTYYVLREYHKWEKDDEADDLLFNVINVLIRTENEIGYDNLHELDTSVLTPEEIAMK